MRRVTRYKFDQKRMAAKDKLLMFNRCDEPQRGYGRDLRRDYQGQPQKSNRQVAPPILNERRRDERQSRDARMRNERPSSSGCAAGGQALTGVRQSSAAGGQLNAKQLNGRISHASGTDQLLALFTGHSASLRA